MIHEGEEDQEQPEVLEQDVREYVVHAWSMHLEDVEDQHHYQGR